VDGRRHQARGDGRPPRPRAVAPASGALTDPLDAVPADRPDPAERLERAERFADACRALAALKANERLAIVLQAQGYSYAEIADLCGWTYTKVNRSLAEGRAKLRSG
jgi:RNA polymerase sigma factor (sigma-70 family)